MDFTVTATEAVRRLGDLLARVRYRHESFRIERNGVVVARLIPAGEPKSATLAQALAAWSAETPDPRLADDLERVRAADRPPANPWAS